MDKPETPPSPLKEPRSCGECRIQVGGLELPVATWSPHTHYRSLPGTKRMAVLRK